MKRPLKNPLLLASVLWMSVLGICLFAIYFPTFSASFLPWDDDYNITLNPIYKSGDWLRFWTEPFYGMYIPATNTLWGLLYKWSEGSAGAFRIFNFSLHLINTFLTAWLLKFWFAKLDRKDSKIWIFGAALFALHPLQVETVAWISGGRDLLSTTCALLALLCYFHLPNWKGFVIGAVFFTLGLLSKPQIAALPAVIFCLAWILEPERWKKALAQMLVWTLPVFALAAVTFKEQKEYVSLTVEFWQRPLVMLDSYGFYVSKLLWPSSLAVDYGRSPVFLLQSLHSEWHFITLAAFLMLTLFFLLFRKSKSGLLLLAWIFSLLPVSGLVDFAYQDISTTADHYNYFPLLSLSFLCVEALQPLARKNSKLTGIFASLALVALAVLSLERVQVWLSPEAFFEDMLAKNPHSYSALIGMGGVESEKLHPEKALTYYRSALQEHPQDMAATANIAATLFRLQRYPEVLQLQDFLRSESFKRAYSIRHVASANILATFGSAAYFVKDLETSIFYLCESRSINPFSVPIQNNLDKLLQIYHQQKPQAQCAHYGRDEDFFLALQAHLARWIPK